MADRDPSRGALLLTLLALALVAGSAALPWWSHDTSTGRKTPEGGPQDPEDTRVERHSYDAGPFWQRGDVEPSDPEGAKQAVLALGLAAAAAGMALLVAFAGEVARRWAAFPRAPSLACHLAACSGLAVALAVAWLVLPGTMAGHGVEGAFTDRLLETHYVRTTLGPGWVAGALAVASTLGAFAFRYQAGSNDAAAVEAYA